MSRIGTAMTRLAAEVSSANTQLASIGVAFNSAASSLSGDSSQSSDSDPSGKHGAGVTNNPTSDKILTDYQVAAGDMTAWDGGWPINTQLDKPLNITEAEASMLNRLSLLEKCQFYKIYNRMFDDADAVFAPEIENGKPNRNDNHNDAYRHALWSARLTQEFGEEWALQYTTAHERVPDNEPQREAMDLYNNSVGIQIAADNPNSSNEEFAALIDDGTTVVIDTDGDLAWSDNVLPGQTGHPTPNQSPLPGKDPGEPHAKTDS